MATQMKVKKGDLVQVLSGKDRGKQGRVLVENLNMIKRHTRPRPMSNPSRMGAPQMAPGGVIEKAAPIPVSNVMVVCPTCRLPTRVGTVIREVKGVRRRLRVCRRADCGQGLDK